MKIRKTHPGDTTSVSIDTADILSLLKSGRAVNVNAHYRIALTENAKEAVVERDVELYQKGLLNNVEFLGLQGQVMRAINLIEETARDYERLANTPGVDAVTKLELAYRCAGLSEALTHLSNTLEPEEEAPDAG